jgi:hypothetical protein
MDEEWIKRNVESTVVQNPGAQCRTYKSILYHELDLQQSSEQGHPEGEEHCEGDER